MATLVMLFTVGWLSGHNPRNRFGYMVIAWGVWDILYYVFLYLIVGWPTSLFEWDVLFLLPLPWWGPVLAPVSIAALMIAGGTLMTQFNFLPLPPWPSRWPTILSVLGAAVALLLFMADAIRVVGQNMGQAEEHLGALLPNRFSWPLFCLALILMALPVIDMGWHAWRASQARNTMLRT
jgi:hypothetical protein